MREPMMNRLYMLAVLGTTAAILVVVDHSGGHDGE